MTNKFEVFLALILVGSTLALGGVQPITYSLVEILVFLLVILFFWSQKRQNRIDLSLPIWPLLFVLWIALQLLPLPRSFLGAVSQAHRLTLAWLAPIQHAGVWGTLSINPSATLLGFFKILAYVGVFILAIQMFDSARRKNTIVTALIALGCFEAAYGILQFLLGWNKIFGYTNPYDSWVATGTYINRNHFAGLMDLTVPLAFAAAFHTYQLWSDPRRRAASTRSGGESPLEFRIVFFLFLAVIMVIGSVFSYSRGGVLSVAFTLIVLSVLTIFKVRRKSWGLLIAGLATLALGFSLWVGVGGLVHRFVKMGQAGYVSTQRRSMIWNDTLQLFASNPILGTGLGTYEDALRPFQAHLVDLTIDHAHNDYLEFGAETGLVGLVLLFVPIFYLLVRMIICFLKDHRRYRSAILLGCIGSTVGLLIHSLMDFNLQVPANAMIFAAILGIGYKAACVEPRKEVQEQTPSVP
ncbi:MAG TPA: O-antigen ligase family protein [Terriglobia bacterium]|nr:O-antigen ligase family protein [Terriglobia bacterium]